MFFYTHTHSRRAANVILACTLFHSSTPRYISTFVTPRLGHYTNVYENVLTLLNGIRPATFPPPIQMTTWREREKREATSYSPSENAFFCLICITARAEGEILSFYWSKL